MGALTAENPEGARVVGRYVLHGEIASGGMATVHVGRLRAAAGFSRTVAIKRLHPHLAKDPEFLSMFVDEARLAARISHPNVVSTIDVVAADGELLLVMDYVQGESLARLLRARRTMGELTPPAIVVRVMSDVLYGLHAAHEAKSEAGTPLGLVHRDVSPQNVIVGVDGVARVVDFGVAKAAMRLQLTEEGQVKGKLSYMAPEQAKGASVDRRTDVFAASIIAWEALTGARLFASDEPGSLLYRVLSAPIPRPSSEVPDLPPALEDVVMRGLAREPDARFESARAMALALERAVAPASAAEVGEWVADTARESIDKRARQVAEIESVSSISLGAGAADEDLATPPISGLVSRSLTRRDGALGPRGTTPASRGLLMGLGAGAVVIFAAGAIAAMLASRPRARAVTTEGVLAPSAVPGSTSALAGAASAPPLAPPSAPSDTETPQSVPVEQLPIAPSALPTPRPASVNGPAAPGLPSPARPRAATRPGCDPPYTIDRGGFRVLKPECL